jgi:hypothetical protein
MLAGGADLAPDVLHRAVTDQTDIRTARDVLTGEMQARPDEIAAADAAARPSLPNRSDVTDVTGRPGEGHSRVTSRLSLRVSAESRTATP